MPFTFSHPAIVLPFVYLPKHWFSLTGLVVGSLTPDFEYFLRMKIKGNYGHTIEGLLWFDLPLGLLLAFIFHNIVRDSLIDNLPSAIQSRLSTFKKLNWSRHFKTKRLVVVISILIGAASHILWDGLAHDNGYSAQTFLKLPKIINVFGNQISFFKIFERSSTVLGIFLIAYTVYKLPTEKNKKIKIDLKYWGLLIGLTLVIILLKFLSGLEIDQYKNVIVSIISAILLSLTLTPIILNQCKTGGNN
ncbi:DUF4184 family protein [Autumnicola psychrophila]|uniref:DUF4184 family protein n=1 Tax=Autumnicola psychrophila TaxID=3075592 RepID=A0ABU3DUJ7_9FLAO|nr:DUF4184 family protein [Zunongwangia sp. F225]MDT0687370.1 DUF4184 family protein [Zunongwangia sp. F225]